MSLFYYLPSKCLLQNIYFLIPMFINDGHIKWYFYNVLSQNCLENKKAGSHYNRLNHCFVLEYGRFPAGF